MVSDRWVAAVTSPLVNVGVDLTTEVVTVHSVLPGTTTTPLVNVCTLLQYSLSLSLSLSRYYNYPGYQRAYTVTLFICTLLGGCVLLVTGAVQTSSDDDDDDDDIARLGFF